VVRPSEDSYRHMLAHVADQLPEDHGRILRLRLIEELTLEQAAQLMRMTLAEATVLYDRALHEMRAKLRKRP